MTTRTRRSLALAVLALAVSASPALATTHTQTSSNWAGYVASAPGVTFRHISATWVLPAATCPVGARSYEASWVGLGGYHTTSDALEQIGTESDCGRAGNAAYSAWYELVPSASASIHMTVKAGDTVSASVGVRGHIVSLRLTDVTRGTVFTKILSASEIDVTAADWIVEAPAECDGNSCEALPLANFGTEDFSAAAVVATDGLGGSISDAAWSATAISLSASKHHGHFASSDASTHAAAGILSGTGDAFSVTYGQSSATATPPNVTTPASPTPSAPSTPSS
jgi:hypothetical protein